MPHSIAVNEAANTLVVRHWGTVDFVELCQAIAEITAPPHYRPELKILSDFSESTADLDLGQVDELVVATDTFMEQTFGNTKWAIVAKSEENHWLAQLYLKLRRKPAIDARLFRNLDSAWTWLGEDAAKP